MSRGTRTANLWIEDGELVLQSVYDVGFIMALKLVVPSYARQWDAPNKVWRVRPQYKPDILKALKDYGYIYHDAANGAQATTQVEVDVIRLNYLGNARRRASGEVTASGMNERGEWVYSFPLSALQDWFGVKTDPTQASTYYEMLGVNERATLAEIKKGYRNGAKLWHPDANSDPGAAEVFILITEAYEVLANDRKRARYDAAKRMVGSAPRTKKAASADVVWPVPDRFRCGYVKVEGQWLFGRSKLAVARIIGWDDIVNTSGQRMTARWTVAGGNGHVDYDWV